MAMTTDHAPLSPLTVGSSELDRDILAALDEILAFTPESTAQPPLDSSFQLSDAFDVPEVPNPYEHMPLTETTTPEPAKTEASTPTEQGGKGARATPYPQTKPKRRRKRPKDELDYLRVKVRDLEEELTKLTQSAGKLSPLSDEEEELFSRWKQVAERQKEEANCTVVENLKLRAMLEGQLQIARRLEAAITDHHQEAANYVPWNFVRPDVGVEESDPRRPRAASISEEQIFAELNGSLESQYATVDSVLDDTGISSVFNDAPGGVQLIQDENGISFGHKEVRLLPFSLSSVNRVMWSVLLCDDLTPQMGTLQTRILNNDHLNATIVDSLQLPKSSSTKVTMRMAIRRYFEPERIVVVWSTCMEIAGSVFVRLREKGIHTLANFDFVRKGSSTKISPTGTVMRSIVDIKPETVDFGSNAESGARTGEMTDLVLGTYHRNLGILVQVIENLLLNDIMGQKDQDP